MAVQIQNHKLKTAIPVNNQLLAANYKFDKIFLNISQEEIYNVTASTLIKDALIGINGTIMCYGQTGAGKTYTMSGLSQLYVDRGIIPRGIAHLFEEIQKNSALSISVKLSYFEIYNEQIIDLLNDISSNKALVKQSFDSLQVAESNDQVYIKGLKCLTVNNLEEALTVLFEGELNRTIASHSLNRLSSRSHAIFTIYLKIIDPMDSNGCTRCSKIHYVDLAGSERLKGTQTTDKLFKEATYINRSLAFLEQTILALSDPSRNYIPYRQSKLTHFLKNSIGGRCQTILIANVWNKCEYVNETLSTLRFASRAMSVPCKPAINQTRDPMAIIKNLEKFNGDLLRELLMYDTLNNRGQISYEPLTEKQRHKIRNSVLKYLNNEVKDLECFNESLNQYETELTSPKRSTDVFHTTTLNNDMNKLVTGVKSINNVATAAYAKQSYDTNDYLLQFKQVQADHFSNDADLSYQRAKEMVAYRQVCQGKPQNFRKFYRSLKFGSVPMTTRINESVLSNRCEYVKFDSQGEERKKGLIFELGLKTPSDAEFRNQKDSKCRPGEDNK
ncbi:unnamed protein product [Heterobilharzia americana]|nr:unnamed protein product [Heterobilharzia americana]